MFHRISPLILSLLLLMSLMGSSNNLLVLAVSQTVLILVSVYINFRRFGFYWAHLLLPVFFLLGVGATFAVIPNPQLRFAFMIFAVVSFYYMEKRLGRESHLLQNLYLLSVFMIFLGLFAVRFYFVDVSFWWILLLLMIMTYLFALQGFAGVSLPSKRYFAFIITFVVLQAGLGLMLWPTYFLVNTVVLFFVFYLMWLLAFSAFFGKLSPKKIYWQSILVVVALVVTLTSAAWQPIGQ